MNIAIHNAEFGRLTRKDEMIVNNAGKVCTPKKVKFSNGTSLFMYWKPHYRNRDGSAGAFRWLGGEKHFLKWQADVYRAWKKAKDAGKPYDL